MAKSTGSWDREGEAEDEEEEEREKAKSRRIHRRPRPAYGTTYCPWCQETYAIGPRPTTLCTARHCIFPLSHQSTFQQRDKNTSE